MMIAITPSLNASSRPLLMDKSFQCSDWVEKEKTMEEEPRKSGNGKKAKVTALKRPFQRLNASALPRFSLCPLSVVRCPWSVVLLSAFQRFNDSRLRPAVRVPA